MEARPIVPTTSRVSKVISSIPSKLSNAHLLHLFATPEVLELQRKILNMVSHGPPLDTDSLWKEWVDVLSSAESAIVATNEGEHALSQQLAQDENKLQSTLTPEASLSVLGQVHEIGYVMNHPSVSALNAISTVSALTKTHHHAYHDLIRVIGELGSGTYGRVVSATLRDPLTDLRILNILRQMSIINGDTILIMNQDNPLLTELFRYIEALPVALAVKESHEGENLIREYAVGREVWAALARYGIMFVPAMYTTAHCTGREPVTEYGRLIEKAQLRGACGGYQTDTLLMQYASGVTLFDAEIEAPEMDIVLLYLHSTLAYLHKQIGFVHGDLNVANVMLEGMDEGRVYSLPILSENGDVLFRVNLPFNPILIDLGAATTTKICGVQTLYSPLSSQLDDVFTLYFQLNKDRRLNGYNSIAINYVSRILAPIILDWDKPRDQNVKKIDSYIPRVGVDIIGLSHKEIVSHILGNMYIGAYQLDIPHTPRRDILAHNFRSDDYRLVAETAKSVQALYRDKAMGSDPDNLIRNYLRETVEFYSPRASTPKLLARERPSERVASISPTKRALAAPSISSGMEVAVPRAKSPLQASGKLPVFQGSPGSEYYAYRIPQRRG